MTVEYIVLSKLCSFWQ